MFALLEALQKVFSENNINAKSPDTARYPDAAKFS